MLPEWSNASQRRRAHTIFWPSMGSVCSKQEHFFGQNMAKNTLSVTFILILMHDPDFRIGIRFIAKKAFTYKEYAHNKHSTRQEK